MTLACEDKDTCECDCALCQQGTHCAKHYNDCHMECDYHNAL